MNKENAVKDKTSRTKMEEWLDYRKSNVYSDKLMAAAIQKEIEGDQEIADVMRTLSAQLAFSGPDDDSPAVEETRSRLSQLITDREEREHMHYHKYMSDEEVLRISNGEVRNSIGINRDICCYTEDGMYDPRIFGGQAFPPSVGEDGKVIRETIVRNVPGAVYFGHITLPCYLIAKRDLADVSNLTGLKKETVQEIADCNMWVDRDMGNGVKLMTYKEFLQNSLENEMRIVRGDLLTGGDAIRALLENLELPDHPENMCFRILPVPPVFMRRAYFDEEDFSFVESSITTAYEWVLNTAQRVSKLQELCAPLIIRLSAIKSLNTAVDKLFGSRDNENSLYGILASSKCPKEFIVPLRLALRLRVMGFDVSKPEEPISYGPARYSKFPEMIRKKLPDGTLEDIPFDDVVCTIFNKVDEMQNEMAQNVIDEDTDEEETEQIKAMRDETDDVCLDLCDIVYDMRRMAVNNEPIIVEEDEMSGYRIAG